MVSKGNVIENEVGEMEEKKHECHNNMKYFIQSRGFNRFCTLDPFGSMVKLKDLLLRMKCLSV